ncbi:zinc transport system substrate-binding protein [Rhodobium orientis]|uniref:High-affinity zinc uptake system protein ZnuA n=1 Tax=Rhodobium orientis TaxID=34017 RepID=A0A327JQE9_9HYPH|nr:zinc ABC transporter substrate-binding protein [Rhodobium orientis]MBB4304946.1 zinc transport system substrate-binding protein [Rhodobium orientis]MBK5951265.1 zinc ABC transporter substrate-binding protein [Rhodobium orientis]RAI27102.1 zinc ABC transporter substrate-binding protein [Rhodobium orientis]
MRPTAALTFSALLAAATAGLMPAGALATERVVVSIKPLHSLVSGVMEGVGTPELIVDGAGSPHSYSLKPSQAQDLQDADIVFWIGPALEPFLEKAITTLGNDARKVALMDAPGLTLLPTRSGGAFEHHHHHDGDAEHHEEGHEHEHGDEADHNHAAAEHEEDHDRQHADADEHEHGDAEEHDHDHGPIDPHLWLDPENARVFVGEIARVLSEADPENAKTYAANAKSLDDRLDGLEATLTDDLKPVRGRPFITFHDAYQYFEHRFGLASAGSISVNPESIPGAERVAEIHERIAELGAACVFAEPQFTPRLIAVVTEGTGATSATLDPLGAELDNGSELYFSLLENLGASLRTCLADRS